MMAEYHDVRFTRGDSWDDLKVRWKDSDGVPVPLASARMQVRPRLDSPDLILDLPLLPIDADNFVAPVLDPGDTQDLTSGVYDIEATATNGKVKTLVTGKFIVDKDVTHA